MRRVKAISKACVSKTDHRVTEPKSGGGLFPHVVLGRNKTHNFFNHKMYVSNSFSFVIKRCWLYDDFIWRWWVVDRKYTRKWFNKTKEDQCG